MPDAQIEPVRVSGPHRLTMATVGQSVRVWLALAIANARYWRTVAPIADAQIEHWRERASAIPDGPTRSLALAKLDGERFNAEAGAMLATFAPTSRRQAVVEVIVALQLLFDLLDGLSECAMVEPIEQGERLFAVFVDALSPAAQPGGADASLPAAEYMTELATAARQALAELPATAAVIRSAHAAASRAAAAQIHMHAVPQLGVAQLRIWAQAFDHETSLAWREFAAGSASSVLCAHALIAASADPRTTVTQANEIDRAYLSICVLLTLLDSLTDREQDGREGKLGYVDLYDDDDQLALVLERSLADADAQARRLAKPARHLMMLNAVVAYYASAPGAEGFAAAPLLAPLLRGSRPLITPTLLVMRLWRSRRRAKGRA